MLAQLGVDIANSVNIAILNGDDYAVEILLHALKVSGHPGKIDVILDATKLAAELRYSNILTRLDAAMETLALAGGGFNSVEGMESGVIPSYNEYLPVSSEQYEGGATTDSGRGGGSIIGKLFGAFGASSSSNVDDLSVDVT